jgi:hypothetical protein
MYGIVFEYYYYICNIFLEQLKLVFMRKLFFLLLLAIPVLVTSCGDDEDGVTSGSLKVTYKVSKFS